MLSITCDEAPILRSLMVELGVRRAQDVADMAIDLYSHCLGKIMASGEPCRMELDQIHQISPAAITMLRLTGQVRSFRLPPGTTKVGTPAAGRPLTLTFSGERFNVIQSWKRRLGLDEESCVLQNAVAILKSAVNAAKDGDAIMVYRKHSTLHAKSAHRRNPTPSCPPPRKTNSLLN